MRFGFLGITLFLSLFSACPAQNPTDGHVEGNAYVNSYFRLSYSWPRILNPVDNSTLKLPAPSPYANEFLLFAARQGDEPHGVVVLAEKLNVRTPHSTGIRDGADFLDRLIRGFKPEEQAVILSRKHFTNADGIPFDEFDYTTGGEGGEYSSGIAAQVGAYLIAFKCDAKSSADLAQMTKSIIALHVQK
jgi:hypothetical protein